VNEILIFRARLLDERVVDFALTLRFRFPNVRAFRAVAFDVFRKLDCGRRGDEAAINATDKGICAETIRAVNRIVAFTRRE
jgi:hypothetical protein